MKRVLIDPATNAVLEVQLLDAASPTTIDVDDDVRVGPGMTWNGKRRTPEFAEVEPAGSSVDE